MVLSPSARQILVAVSPQLSAMSMGGSLGFPSVLLQQLQSKESSIQPDLSTMTWITSTHGIAGIGAILMPSLMQRTGRKRCFILSCVILIIGWIISFAATNAIMIIIAECVLGFGCNCIVVVNLMTVSEMLAPKYRTISMLLLGITQATGIIFVTSVGTFVNWRILSLTMCVPIIIALVIACMWPESPPWLAYKRNFGECEKAFKCLRGTDEESMKELHALMTAQKHLTSKKFTLKDISRTLKRRDFYLPSFYMVVILSNIYTSGGVSLHLYGRYVIEAATGDEKIATIGFLLFNVNLFIGAFVTLYMIRRFNTKTVLSVVSIRLIFLYGGSLVSYLQTIGMLSKSPWIFTSFYEAYMFLYSSGLNSLSFALAIELIPVKHRGLGGALYNIVTCSLHFATNKLLPYLIVYIGIWGMFLLFAVNGTICHLLIWKYVPETKNRTLQEIEDHYNKIEYNDCAPISRATKDYLLGNHSPSLIPQPIVDTTAHR